MLTDPDVSSHQVQTGFRAEAEAKCLKGGVAVAGGEAAWPPTNWDYATRRNVRHLGRERPWAMPEIDLSFRPGSYWPNDDPPEDGVAIADTSVDSVLGDTNSVIATSTPDGRIRFSLHSDEGSPLVESVEPQSASQPLSLGELIELIDNVDLGETLKRGAVLGILDLNSLVGTGNPADADFIVVSSEFYPALGEHYDRETLAWVMGDSA